MIASSLIFVKQFNSFTSIIQFHSHNLARRFIVRLLSSIIFKSLNSFNCSVDLDENVALCGNSLGSSMFEVYPYRCYQSTRGYK